MHLNRKNSRKTGGKKMQEKRKVSRRNSKEETNSVMISGRITEEFKFDHEVKWEKFYATRIAVRRKVESKIWSLLLFQRHC